MKYIAEFLTVTSFIVTWLCGIVLAAGFWSTAFAIYVPPYAWHLLAEKAMKLWGIA